MSAKPSGLTQRKRVGVVHWLRKGKVFVILCVALCAFWVATSASFRTLPAPERWETQLYDIRFRSRGNVEPHPQIAIAGITPTSLNQSVLEPFVGESEAIALMHAHNWPWPRTVHAKIIERIFEYGARVVAVDVVFAADRPEDDALAAVLEKYSGRVILASIVQDSEGRLTFLHPNSRLQQSLGSSDAVGYASVIKDPRDGVVRRFDYRTSLMREFGHLDDDAQDLQSFAALAVAKYRGDKVAFGYGEFLNYQGLPRTYPPVPVEEMFMKGSSSATGRIFEDKLVFYGPIAEVLHDVHPTPFGVMPGVEIHAQLAASLMNSAPIVWVSNQASLGSAALLALLAAAVVLLVRNPIWQVMGLVGSVAIFWGVTQGLFVSRNLIFPVVPPVAALFVTGVFGVAFLFFLEQWERTHTREVLDRTVNKRIAKVLMHNAEFNLARKGERRKVAILFSDIRSFTTWSEKAEPEHLVGQLNEYFERMVELVEGNDSLGNAQKFIGDAILAAWGDTPENRFGDAEDARRAVAVALRMRLAVTDLNQGWAARGDRIPIEIGMGINHGEVVVGEVGHPNRGEYTVLGDGVNFAARLESATKQFHTDCLVGESVESLTRQHFTFRHVDYVRVKGKTRPVNIYIPLSAVTVPPPAWLADYHRARALYVDRRFSEAAALFREVEGRIGTEDFLCQMYADRCDRYAQEAPPSDWDGSFTMTDK